MKILAIDTADESHSIAILVDGKIIAERNNLNPSQQAEQLFSKISDIFSISNLSYKDLSAIAVNIGPGSFTGLRIGIAAARGIALASGLPVIGISRFDAIIYASEVKYPAAAIIDAKRNQFFFQFYNDENNKEEPLLIDYDEAVSKIKRSSRISLAGKGLNLIKESLDITKGTDTEPNAAIIGMLAAEKLKNKAPTEAATPLYIRKPDAKKQINKLTS